MATIPSESVPPGLRGAAIGLVGIGGEIGGSLCGPVLGGALAQHFGLFAPMVLSFAGIGAVFLLGLVIRETRNTIPSWRNVTAPASPNF
jgi:MFS family permease